jgi:hypothetical protein
VKAFTHIGDERAVGPLIRLFNNKEYFYLERDIIYTLGAIGAIGGKESILALMNLLNKRYTPDKKFGGSFEPLYPYMGADVAKALVNIGKDSEPYLIESLKSQDYLERLYAAYALSLLKNTSAVEHLNRALKTEENPTVKTYLEMAIAEIQGKEFISPLLQQLKIWTEPSKKKYSANETISVYLYLQNKGNIPFTINAVPLEYADLALEIFDPEGKPAINPIIEFCRTTFPTKDSLITLAPGKVHKFGPYHLQDFYRFDRKGKYRIIGVYANSSYACGIEFGVYALTGKVESEQAIIEIK